MQNTESYHDWLEYEAWNESQMAKEAYKGACQLIFGPQAQRPDYEWSVVNGLMKIYFNKGPVSDRILCDLCQRGLVESITIGNERIEHCTAGGLLIAGHLMTNIRDFTFEHLGS